MYYVFIDDVQWAHLHAYFDPSIRRESYESMLQSYKQLVSFPVSMVCHTEFLLSEARIALNKVRLGYPIFPLFFG
jgi:hypothetical protein